MENSLSNSGKLKTTRVCTLMITHSCNLNCTYCFEKYKSGKKMSFDIAKQILKNEFQNYKGDIKSERLAIELFGGEPFTNYPLIQQIYDWTKKQTLPFNYIFQITTNGTLLTPEIKDWLKDRKDDFRLVMSVDGTEAMQQKNRGSDLSELPIHYVKDVWPNSYFKLTLSSETLPDYAEGVISLYEQGFKIASSLAEGQLWKENDHLIYRTQLEKIAEYFLEHPEKELEHPFNFLFKEYTDARIDDKLPHKNCGCGTTIAMYDTDGTLYPCHLFLPMVHGNNAVLNEIADVDFSNPGALVDEQCISCPILKLCKTCFGYNYSQRGCITNRDKGMCKLRLVEAQVIAAFQIRYFSSLKRKLNDYELLMLKAALDCYKRIKDITF